MGGVGLLRLVTRGLQAQVGIQTPLQFLYPDACLDRPGTSKLRLAGENILEALGVESFAGRSRSSPDVAQVEDWFADQPGPLDFVAHGTKRSALLDAIESREVDVVLPAFRSLGGCFPVPWVGYIFDFQHRYLPQFFSKRERLSRHLSFGRMLRDAPVVIVNARAVRDDVQRFFPGREERVVHLPFAPDARAEWWRVEPRAVRDAYGLPPRYFLICNQFWVHKDHRTAIRALALLHADPSCRDIALVCTGKQEDFRAAGHFERLSQLVKELRLESSVRFLGIVPKLDQMAIVRSAAAVVQPSLFEGGPGGGAANDAVAVGTPVIASDIPVNREIDLGAVSFFTPSRPDALAQRMREALGYFVRPSPAELLAQSESRFALLGTCLLAAIDKAVKGAL